MDFVQQNILLIAVVVVSGGMLLWQTLQAGGKQVSPTDATRMLNRDEAVVIDVRPANEFAAGHVPDAINIPIAALKDRLADLKQFEGRPLIINCASGARSGSACQQLRKLGIDNAFNLSGGMNAWVQAGLPVKKGSK
jgi:rhodanese-related sulfurtransferase